VIEPHLAPAEEFRNANPRPIQYAVRDAAVRLRAAGTGMLVAGSSSRPDAAADAVWFRDTSELVGGTGSHASLCKQAAKNRRPTTPAVQFFRAD